ncbi:hypothetical protein FACS189492_2480 [Clostridia bacterium]|nr:hypothetical protein FACS189492_2480 [Clostridia bacterium]
MISIIIVRNVIEIIYGFAAFALLFIAVPYKTMGFKFVLKDFLYNVFASLTVGCFSMILLVYLLAAFKLLSRPGLILGILLIVGGACVTLYARRSATGIDGAVEYLYLYTKGARKLEVTTRQLVRNFFAAIGRFALQALRRPFSLICFAAGSLFAVYIRAYTPATQLFFGISDAYLQMDWTAQMIGGNIFPNGVYPFGMHAIVATLSLVFNIDLIIVIRVGGVIFGTLIVLSLYLLLSNVFKTKTAIGIGYLIYCVSPIIQQGAYFRQSYTLPQELAQVFLFPCAIFLLRYMNTRKVVHLVFCAMAFALVIACHFYVALIGAVLMACMIAVHFRQMCKQKVFGKVVAAAALSVVLSAGPLVAYNVLGHIPWESSMYWALNIMGIGNPPEAPSEQPADQGVTPDTPAEELPLIQRLINVLEHPEYYLAYMSMCAVGVLFALLLMLMRKHGEYARMLLSVCLYCIGLVVIVSFPLLGLPNIIQLSRTFIFYYYNMGFALAVGLELFTFLLVEPGNARVFSYCVNFLLLAGFAWCLLRSGVQLPGTYAQVQYNGAVESYYKIVGNYTKFKWTIISPVDELGAVRSHGWHYELSDFVYELAAYEDIHMGGDDVFIFIEKRPILPYRMRAPLSEPPFEPEQRVSEAYAAEDIMAYKARYALPSKIYTEQDSRRVLESKAYYWAQAYQKSFPEEMDVFHEDEDVIVYHLRQNDPYAVNNLLIEYRYN